jgi:AraC family transcriptional regulator
MNVTDICYEVGYNSLGTFTRRFTELVGVSPTRLRSMSRCYDCDAIKLIQESLTPARPGFALGVAGSISAPPEFRGQILVGVFRHPVPQRAPVACTILSQSGPFKLRPIPDGRYFISALALTAPSDPAAILEYEPAWRTRSHQLTISNQIAGGTSDLRFRRSTVFDPPILMALPLLLTQMARNTSTPL